LKNIFLTILCLLISISVFAGWDDENPFSIKGGITEYRYQKSIADDGTITFPTGVAGMGQVMAGDGEEWMQVHFTSAGVTTKVTGTGNTAASDSDGNLCVYDGGAGIIIKNRLAATKVIRLIFYYSK